MSIALCTACGARVPAAQVWERASLYLEKDCPLHGTHRSLIATDHAYWSNVEATFLAKADQYTRSHQNPLMVFVEVIDACDFECTTCIAGSMAISGNTRDPGQLIERVRRIAKGGTEINLLLLTGGEPTLHPELPQIISGVAEYADQLMLVTNGARIANDRQYVEELRAASCKLQVYLQFDSLRSEALIELRGKDLRSIRYSAIENLGSCAIPTTLVSVIKKGVNEEDLVPTVEFALSYNHIIGATFQPIRAAGRHASFDYTTHHITLTAVREALLRGLNLPDSCLRPHPADPYRVSMGYFCRDSHKDVTDLFWGPDAGADLPLYMRPSAGKNLAPEHRPFRLAIVSYYDQHDLLLENARPEGIVFLTDGGALLPLEQHFALSPRDSSPPHLVQLRRTA
jgi:7,8-dihydro-6-hydroxymethylpterin dimethyltransferase